MDSLFAIQYCSVIIMMLILLYGSLFETKNRTKKLQPFSGLILTVIFLAVADLLPIVFNTSEHSPLIAKSCYDISIWGGFVFTIIFSAYLYQVICGRKKVSKIPFAAVIVIKLLLLITTIVLLEIGLIYSLDEGVFVHGSFYTMYLIFNVSTYLLDFILMICYFRLLGLQRFIATVSYMVFPSIGILLNINHPELKLNLLSISFSVLVMYIMIHSESEQVSNTKARSDPLTGLLNRRALDELTATIDDGSRLGVVFCDLNGLKYTNDHFGHSAGDGMLCKLADELLSCFRRNEVFRISGDEFLVVMPSIPKASFDLRVASIEQTLKSMETPIAAIGYAFSENGSFIDLFHAAEKNMYADKEAFYQNHPEYQR